MFKVEAKFFFDFTRAFSTTECSCLSASSTASSLGIWEDFEQVFDK